MKKTLLTSIAIVGMTLGSYAQGLITVANNNLQVVGISTGTQGNYYDGTLTVQLWAVNSQPAGTVLDGINTAADNGAALTALTAAGFAPVLTFHGPTTGPGTFNYGDAVLPSPFTGAGPVGMALVAWNSNTGTDWNAATLGGVVSFIQKAGNPAASPPDTSALLTGWDATGRDLIMTPLVVNPIPEPSTFALAGLGAAALMIFRRRK